MRITLQYIVVQQAVVHGHIGEIHEAFIQKQVHSPLLTPLSQSQDVSFSHEVTGRVVRINEQKQRNILVGEERHQVIRRITEVLIIADVRNYLTVRQPVGILIECRENHTDFLARLAFHHDFNQLRSTVAHNDKLLTDTEILTRKKRIHGHS